MDAPILLTQQIRRQRDVITRNTFVLLSTQKVRCLSQCCNPSFSVNCGKWRLSCCRLAQSLIKEIGAHKHLTGFQQARLCIQMYLKKSSTRRAQIKPRESRGRSAVCGRWWQAGYVRQISAHDPEESNDRYFYVWSAKHSLADANARLRISGYLLQIVFYIRRRWRKRLKFADQWKSVEAILWSMKIASTSAARNRARSSQKSAWRKLLKLRSVTLINRDEELANIELVFVQWR